MRKHDSTEGSIADSSDWEDDSLGFAQTERDYVRERFVPDFEWVTFDEPSPRWPLSVRLSEARIAVLGTAGAHIRGEPGMSPRGEVRFFPSDTTDFDLTHPGFDTTRAAQDPDVVFPLETLRGLVAPGIIGEVAPSAISTMGFVPQGERIVEHLVPQVVKQLRDEEVHLALLVPA